MDVRLLFFLLSVFSLAACQNNKTSETVFPEAGPKAPQSKICGQQMLQTRFLVTWNDGRITLERAQDAEEFKSQFLDKNLALIQHVEFDKILKLHETSPVVQAQADTQSWGQERIGAPKVWAQNIKGQSIKVAVVDSAVDYDHPQLAPRLSKNRAEIDGSTGQDDDKNGFVDDIYGWDFFKNSPKPILANRPNLTADQQNHHGTHVSGIILADSTKGPMQGIAPEAELIPANFMNDDGEGSLSAAISAINYSVQRGARVINASWGGNCYTETLKQTIENLASKNVLFVVASGNEGLDLDVDPEYPAAFKLPHQITVGATYVSDNMASWSNSSFNLVQLVAPGGEIYSTFPTVFGSYGTLSGTSMATPFVSGAAALVFSARPQATAVQVKEALLKTVDLKEYKTETRGRLNVEKAVAEIIRMLPQAATP